MTIGFIHQQKAFLPGMMAYVDFFSARGLTTHIIAPAELETLHCDVEWHFMGQHLRRNTQRVTIHEYASASVPPFRKIKDSIKKLVNAKPDYRIFNSEYVLKQMKPNDGIPFGMRDCGIPSGTGHLLPLVQKAYDFVYVGTVDKGRKPEILLNCFANGALKNHTLLVLSQHYQALANAYSSAVNITFKGPIPQREIYAYIQQARFGINYIPDIAPFNQQASAKFLDYAACRLPIVTTDYAWVRSFQNKFGGSFFYLDGNLKNFTWEKVTDLNYAQPDLSSCTYEEQIRKSGVLEFLESKFPDIRF